jgi:hypothetical protein
MEPEVIDQQLIKRYLLGELAGEEQTRLEERLMTDRQFFDSLLEAEDELADDYARGALSGIERERFENHFLAAPERREKLGFALALRRYVADATMEAADVRRKSSWSSSLLAFFRAPSPALAWSLAAATLLLALGATWLLIETARLRNQLSQAQNQRPDQTLEQQLASERARNRELAGQLAAEQIRRAQLERDLAQSKPSPPGEPAALARIFSLALLPGLARDPNQGARIELPSNAAQLQLRLELEAGGYSIYRAELRTDEGQAIRTFDRLKARQGKAVIVSLPARLLSGGDYRVTLSGSAAGANYERAGTYFFTVVKK